MRQAQVDRAVLHATIGHSGDDMTEHYSHVGAKEKMAAGELLVRSVRSAKNSPSDSPDCPNGEAPPDERRS